MLARTRRILLLAAIVAAASGRPAVCLAWSLWPFGSESKAEPKPTRPPPRPVKKEPSTWQKITAGPKNLCGKVGDALTFKKPPPPKKTFSDRDYAVPRMPAPAPKKESNSWFGSWFKPAEPEKPKSVPTWMATTKRVDP